jgi:hypothetical protein
MCPSIVSLFVPLFELIAADTPAADKLCGHFSSYSEGLKRLTCSCNVSFSNLNDPNFACHPVTWDAMHTISTTRSKEECIQLCPNTTVAMHLPTLKVVVLFTRYLVLCQWM